MRKGGGIQNRGRSTVEYERLKMADKRKEIRKTD